MTRWLRHLAGSALALAVLIMSNPAAAAPIVLTFEGLADWEGVAEFYNGGTGTLGSGPGSNHGIRFTNAIALIDSDAGGSGNFGGEPSPSTAHHVPGPTSHFGRPEHRRRLRHGLLVLLHGHQQPRLDHRVGWPGRHRQHSGDSGPAADAVQRRPGPVTASSVPSCPSAWSSTASPGRWTSRASPIRSAFDDITIGSATPGRDRAVPEPGSLLLLAAGLPGWWVLRRQHARRAYRPISTDLRSFCQRAPAQGRRP